jgi:hypothetical protein
VRPAAKIATAVVLVAIAAGVLFGVRALRGLRAGPSRSQPVALGGRVQGQPLAVPLRRTGTGASARARLSGIAVERRFVGSYLRFLQGSIDGSALRYASITARDDAISGGRIPAGLRDGSVQLRSVQQNGATLYSAQATVVAANREASFPFAVSLIREHDGWWVSDVQPPDFDVARPAPSSRRSPTVPAAARHTTTGFAIRPLERDRFAVTVTANAAGRRLRFTLMMLRTRRGWECDAFL